VVLLTVEDGPQPPGDVGVVVEPQHRVGLGQRLGEVLAVALGQAAHRDDRLRRTPGLEVGGLEQRVHRVLLGGLDEPTGVHDHGLGLGGVVDQAEPAELQPAGQLLGVDLVAGAAEGDQRDGDRCSGGGCARAGGSGRSSHDRVRV
jgi:hypothetical protein